MPVNNPLRYQTSFKSILIGIMGMLFSCENDLEDISKIKVPKNSPSEVIEGLKMVFTDSGRVKAKLRSSYVEKFSGNDAVTIFSDGLKITFFDSHGEPMSTLISEYGEIRSRGDIMVAKHNVVFSNQKEGKRLKTEKLIWDKKANWNGKRGKVYTDQPVTFESEQGVLYGEAFTTNASFENPILKTSSGEIYTDSTKKWEENEQK